MMLRCLLPASAISVRILPPVRSDSLPTALTPLQSTGALVLKRYLKTAYSVPALNERLYGINWADPSIRGTATRLINVVAHELILHYTLNTERHLQLYL
jgi:hypothetical protein